MPRKKHNNIPDFQRGGNMLSAELMRRYGSAGTFARLNKLADTTVRQLLAGTYNRDVGISPGKLWVICQQVADGDDELAQMLCARYYSALGVIPEEASASLLMRVTRMEHEQHEIKLALLRAERRKLRPKRNGHEESQ